MTVSLDDRRTVLAVHWNMPLGAACRQFEDWGFVGIEGLKRDCVLNGNAARTKARDNAIARGDMYFWVGSYDWGIGNDSAIYEFTYSVYTGHPGWLFDGAKQGEGG